MLFGFVLLSNAKVFSQTIVNTFGITNIEVMGSSSKRKCKNSNIEFVLWFMGSKQNLIVQFLRKELIQSKL
jgi:hypothetical protein